MWFFVLFCFPLIGSIVLNHPVSSNFNLRPVCSQDKWTGFLSCVASGVHLSSHFPAITIVIDKFMAGVHSFVSVAVWLLMAYAIPSFLPCLREDTLTFLFED